MKIRKYVSSDCKNLLKLFYDTVHTINAQDYTKEQLDAWADGNADFEKWDQALSAHYTLVAEDSGEIIGFGDIDDTGYLDRLYVHKDYQRRGVASALCNMLESAVDTAKITVHASVTAKPFFTARGYSVVRKQQVIRKGVKLTNYVMEKQRKI